jgi:hypothetical protein
MFDPHIFSPSENMTGRWYFRRAIWMFKDPGAVFIRICCADYNLLP